MIAINPLYHKPVWPLQYPSDYHSHLAELRGIGILLAKIGVLKTS